MYEYEKYLGEDRNLFSSVFFLFCPLFRVSLLDPSVLHHFPSWQLLFSSFFFLFCPFGILTLFFPFFFFCFWHGIWSFGWPGLLGKLFEKLGVCVHLARLSIYHYTRRVLFLLILLFSVEKVVEVREKRKRKG